MQLDLGFLTLLLQVFFSVSETLNLPFELTHSRFGHLLLLGNLLVVGLVLRRGVVLETAQLFVQFEKFGGPGFEFKTHFGFGVLRIGQQPLQVRMLVSFLLHLVLVLLAELG